MAVTEICFVHHGSDCQGIFFETIVLRKLSSVLFRHKPYLLTFYQIKAEVDKMLEVRDRAMGLYENMKEERAQFVAKEEDYESRLSKMSEELD